jgi:hypothetical protein
LASGSVWGGVNEVHQVHEREVCARLAVLRELVLVEARERSAEAFLQRVRDWAAVGAEVAREDLEGIVGAVHDAIVELRGPRLALHRVSELAGDEVRHRAEARFLAGVERGLGGEFRIADLRHELLHTGGGGVARAVEFIGERGREQQRGELEFRRFDEGIATGEVGSLGARAAEFQEVEFHGGVLVRLREEPRAPFFRMARAVTASLVVVGHGGMGHPWEKDSRRKETGSHIARRDSNPAPSPVPCSWAWQIDVMSW